MAFRRHLLLRMLPLATVLVMHVNGRTVFSQTVYDVAHVDLGEGYEIAGGTIPVEGTSVTAWSRLPLVNQISETFPHRVRHSTTVAVATGECIEHSGTSISGDGTSAIDRAQKPLDAIS